MSTRKFRIANNQFWKLHSVLVRICYKTGKVDSHSPQIIGKTSAGYILIISQRFKRGSIFAAYSTIPISRSTSPDITKVFHAWLYHRFIKIQSNFRRKKLHRANQGSNLLRGSFSNRDKSPNPTKKRKSCPAS